jgi:hypothetical protein
MKHLDAVLTSAGRMMVGGLTVEALALDGRGGEDVFTWILIVWATTGVVMKSRKLQQVS